MISSQQLGERIATSRKRAALTQAQLAERLGVARTTVVAIEKGERRPSNAELVCLAEILQVTVHDLLREGAVTADVSPRFRISALDRASPQVQEAVERLRGLAGRYLELERLHGLSRQRAPLESLQTYRTGRGERSGADLKLEGEDAARTVRALLGMGDEPAGDLDERLESEAGLRIFYLDGLPAKLAAFLIWSDETGACVAINRAHLVERQRWSLSHELGHFFRDREAGDVLEEGESTQQATEIFPEAFSREFLMPAAGVQKRFAEQCRLGRFTPVDLYALSRAFKVSFQAMALRLEELRLLPRGTYEKIVQSRLRPQDLGPKVQSDAAPANLGLPRRYVALAVSAFDQEMLSESEFAEILGTDIPTARTVFQEHERVSLGDGTLVKLDLSAPDLRQA